MANIRSNPAAHAFIAISALITIAIAATARLAIEPRALAIINPDLCHASSHLPDLDSIVHFEPDSVSAIARVDVHTGDSIIAGATDLAIELRALHTEPFRFATHVYLPALNSTAHFEPDSESAPTTSFDFIAGAGDDLIIAGATGLSVKPRALEPFRFALRLSRTMPTHRSDSNSDSTLTSAMSATASFVGAGDELIIAGVTDLPIKPRALEPFRFALHLSRTMPTHHSDSNSDCTPTGATNTTASFVATTDATTVATVATAVCASPSLPYRAFTHRTPARRRAAPIPRSFASRHATAIAISRATPSSADADGPPKGKGRAYSATGPGSRSKSPGPKRARALSPNRTQPTANQPNQHPDYGQSAPSGGRSGPLYAQSAPSGSRSEPLESAELTVRQKKRNRNAVSKANRAAARSQRYISSHPPDAAAAAASHAPKSSSACPVGPAGTQLRGPVCCPVPRSRQSPPPYP